MAQVSMMGDIYREADKVLVSLGEADPTDCYAFWSIAMVGESGSCKYGLPEDHGPYLDDGMDDLMNKTSDKSIARVAPETLFSRWLENLQQERYYTMWETITLLLRRPYFFRLWPYQEILLPGQGRTWYFSGEHYVAGPAMHKLAKRCLNLLGSGDLTHDVSHQRFQRLMKRDKRPRKQVLIKVLLDTASMKATEPLDRIYAVRALMRQEDARFLAPDYSVKATDLWKKVAQRCMETSTPDALLLSLAGCQRCMPPPSEFSNLPSWLPDFSKLAFGPCQGKLSAHMSTTNNTFKIREIGSEEAIIAKARFCSTVGQRFKINGRDVLYPNNFLQFPQHLERFVEKMYDPDKRSRLFIIVVMIPWFIHCYHYISSTLRSHRKDLDAERVGAFLRQGHPEIEVPNDDFFYDWDDEVRSDDSHI
ncbi:MAG: hypothetical protein M1820_009874 [Bogoriella megaspora]|nr:MAG: hypothetical protein M1820_009874 [Bogoriella megaspora]